MAQWGSTFLYTIMIKHVLLSSALMILMSSCSWIMQPEERERIPQPPPGEAKSSIPHNRTQKFEAESALGPLATPRR